MPSHSRAWQATVFSAVTACALLLGPYDSHGATKVGVASAVNPEATGVPPGMETRLLRAGIDAFAQERVTTGANGQAQFLFLDGSTLSVGPNANVVIDKFVYDPQGRLGELRVSATQGILRFVGGAISKSNAIEITSPVATVGIRGGVAVVNITADTSLKASLLYGSSLTVTAEGVTETIRRPDFTVTVAAGQPPGPPTRLPPEQLAGDLSALQGKRTASGTSTEPLQDQALARSNVSLATGSTSIPGLIAPVNKLVTLSTSVAAVSDLTHRVVEHAVQEARFGTDYTRFRSVFDHLDQLSLARSNHLFGDRSYAGYVGGILDTSSGGVTTSLPISAGSPAVIILDGSQRRVIADFFPAVDGACCFDLSFGGDRNRSAYLATNIFAARNSAAPSTFVMSDGSKVPLVSRAVMVSADALNIPVPGATLCDCRYVKWGWWIGQYQQPSGRIDNVNLGTWVVGPVPTLSQIPQTGTATYSGQVIGSIVKPSGTHYLAGGSFTQSWDFGTRSGTTTIANLDGFTLRGQATSQNGRDYSGAIAGSGAAGRIAGSFFRSPSDPVAETGGNFAFATATGYRAGGTFAARR
ncbi:MAG: FecR domain-containing protein [Alphaproteobacteria bacterium]|nr:FecR domain-containing protein [Alphaproteobacteria bacterium]